MRDLRVSVDSLGVASAVSIAELANVSADIANLRAKTVGLRARYYRYVQAAEAIRNLWRGTVRHCLLRWSDACRDVRSVALEPRSRTHLQAGMRTVLRALRRHLADRRREDSL